MKDIKTLTQLREFIKTEEAFTGEEFQYKGFSISWNHDDVIGVQTPMDGYFRCDPVTQAQYKSFKVLNEKMIGAHQYFLS